MEAELDVGDIVYGHNKINRYKVLRELGKGGFGAVYEVEQLLKKTEEAKQPIHISRRKQRGPLFAMKCELLDGKARILKMELAILREVNKGGRHFCQVYDRSRTDTFNFIIMTLLGHNLFDLRHSCSNNHFTLGTALRVAIQTLESIEDLHDVGYIHRDIKPGNFAIGRAEPRKIYILDFGLSRKYKKENGELRRPRERAGFRGTVRYASRRSHRGEELGRIDDVESWLYVVIELTGGGVPWRESRDKAEVLELKNFAREKHGVTQMLADCPRNFERILAYIDQLDFLLKPDYGYIYELLRRAAVRANVSDDDPYDWEEGGIHHQETERLPPPRLLSDKETPAAGSPGTDRGDTGKKNSNEKKPFSNNKK